MALPVDVTIPASIGTGPVITLSPGKVFLIAGPNGVGKSALIYQLYTTLPEGDASYYPGHRQITFNNGVDQMGQDSIQLQRHLYSQFDAFSRYKGHWSEDHLKSVIRKLTNSEASYNQRLILKIKQEDDSGIAEARTNLSPFGILNAIFASAGLPVRLSINSLGINVTRGEANYQIDQLSDGERAALFVVGAILGQEPGSVILIDEPERHLHPSISAPLIDAAMRARPDICYIFSTHDMSLIESLGDAVLLHLTNSTVLSSRPERRTFELHEIEPNAGLPDDVKLDLIGVRKDVLFVEGEISSLDVELYSRCYESWKVVPKGGWEQCVSAVKVLSDTGRFHWVHAAGIIDADGKPDEEILALKEQGIFPLPCPTVENLFLLRDVMQAVALSLYETEGGSEPELRIQNAIAALRPAADAHFDEIVARRTAWRVNRLISAQKVSVEDMRNNQNTVDAIDVEEVREQVISEITWILERSDILDSLWFLPIKNSSIPAVAATSIGAKNFVHYKNIVLRQMDAGTPAGRAIRAALHGVLPVVGNRQITRRQPAPAPSPSQASGC